ncbi:hypothetical protein Egran_01836 [Elaphomyces granulatus]|uniref:Uncharacterized protein n=1 Tax=Elaphomyces granulatus TaxID=519963 RepID=A0A232M230_9EURO|nr:hypothetical protein Egran_01836 [Elaphomyces granulatus]
MLWRRRPSQTEQEANPSMNLQNPQQIPQRGPIEGPYGQRLTRRVTWRSSTYKLVAYLYLLCVLYLLWLIRDLFFLPFSSTSTTSTSVTSSSTTDGYNSTFYPNTVSAGDVELTHFIYNEDAIVSDTLWMGYAVI